MQESVRMADYQLRLWNACIIICAGDDTMLFMLTEVADEKTNALAKLRGYREAASGFLPRRTRAQSKSLAT